MNLRFSNKKCAPGQQAGSILIIVLWVAFGLVAIALYFAHSMSMELRAADNRVAAMEANQAIEGAALYVSNVLARLPTPNTLPSPQSFRADAVKVGNARFWLIGRDTNIVASATPADHPFWGLIDEASKLNLNTASAVQLESLPMVTQDLAAAIYDWKSPGSTPSASGAKTETYSLQQPAYDCKETNYETTDELRLVYGMNLDLLYGEDANLNGILDPNENDGDKLPPYDNQDGHLDSGILDYVTVWTHEAAVTSNGIPRVAVNDTPGLQQLFSQYFPQFTQYLPTTTGGATPATILSTLQFYYSCKQKQMSESDFQQVEPYLTNAIGTGLLNINTASATALSCAIGTNLAAQILAYRQSNPQLTPTVTWVDDALGGDQATEATVGTNLTAYACQYTADVAAVGHNGRGYRRVRFVFDCANGVPQIIYRQDLTHLGWALGKNLYDQLLADNSK